MRICAISTLLINVLIALDTKGHEISCGDIEECTSSEKCCLLFNSVINTSSFTISDDRDESLRSILFYNNAQVEFLPVLVHKKFPGLISYVAKRGSIKRLTKKNFEKLFHLRTLDLRENLIEMIRSDTFHDVTSLRSINLENNKIKFLKSSAFKPVYQSHLFVSLNVKSRFVNLKSNVCVDKTFNDETFTGQINHHLESCAFEEVVDEKPRCERIDQCFPGWRCCIVSSYGSSSVFENTAFNTSVDESVDAIIFKNNSELEFLPIHMNISFPKLRIYGASHCSIGEIFRTNFQGLTNLEYLNLKGNKISTIRKDTFKDLLNIKVISLAKNKIKFVNIEIFQGNPALQSVNFLANECINETVPAAMFGKTRSMCKFDEIEDPKQIQCSVENEKDIDGRYFCEIGQETVINDEDFTVVGTGVDQIHGIELNFNENIEYLPVATTFLSNLIFYSAWRCSIRKISRKNFAGLAWLERLNFRFNQIKMISSDTFESLVRLERINLSDNKIKLIAVDIFENLPALEFVWLNGNECISEDFGTVFKISQLPSTLNKNCGKKNTEQQIECKIEGHNCILWRATVITGNKNTFSNQQNPAVIHLISNENTKIFFLPILVAHNFPNLKYYRARSCSIREVSKKNFEGLAELGDIELSGNQIYAIRSDTFKGLTKLFSIYLGGNKIKFLNSQLFEGKPELTVVSLDRNDCINEHSYDDPKSLITEVSQRCGFDETSVGDNEVSCNIESNLGQHFCMVDNSAVINSTDFTISEGRDEEVTRIVFESNSKIEFLPILVYFKFSNLQAYLADHCAVHEISKKNFAHLDKLQILSLSHNKIEIIKRDTFHGLLQLTTVRLDGNPIKSMNGRLFEGLKFLNFVNLTQSGCIDAVFNDTEEIKSLSKSVTKRCGFNEFGDANFDKIFENCSNVSSVGGFIIGGDEVKRGEWPFLVALMYKPLIKFFCGGNLITDRHVLTAAHCVHQKHDEKLNASEIVVMLGRHRLKSSSEPNSIVRDVANLFIHPAWNSNADKYDSDLAILALKIKVDLSRFIQPVCVTADIGILEAEDGYVAGWGKHSSDTDHEDVPRQALIRAVNDSYCFENDPKLGDIFSQRSFCAKGQGVGPCHGDSGGGFYVKFGGLWTLRGIVSAGALAKDGGCDIDRYALYTKLIDFAAWIKATVT